MLAPFRDEPDGMAKALGDAEMRAAGDRRRARWRVGKRWVLLGAKVALAIIAFRVAVLFNEIGWQLLKDSADAW
jgi:hypothetical protein